MSRPPESSEGVAIHPLILLLPIALGDPAGPTEANEVLVLTRDVSRGAMLLEQDVERRSIAEALIPPGAMRDPQHAIGAVTRLGLFEGEVLVEAAIGGPEAHSLGDYVPRGTRLLRLDLPYPMPLAHGQFVDLWWQPADRPCAVAQDVYVMDVDPETRSGLGVLIEEDRVLPVLTAMRSPTFHVVGRNELDRSILEEAACSSR